MAHKFKVGQTLSFAAGRMDPIGSRQCKVVRLMPAQIDGEPQYRIKCSSEVAERVVKETALSPG